MATTADPRGNPSDPTMFSPCYTSHHARLILSPPPLTPGHHTITSHHASSSVVASPPVDEEVEEEIRLQETEQPLARPWNLRSKKGFRFRLSSSSSEKRENERARFSVSLSTEEIEEDIYAVTGSRPRRRPKRRPRVVQRQLDLPGDVEQSKSSPARERSAQKFRAVRSPFSCFEIRATKPDPPASHQGVGPVLNAFFGPSDPSARERNRIRC